jgi:hypothetical protein
LIGANSAGKSSVLYSLLTVAQTLANPLSDRPLVLNGHLVRLGLADDVVHESKNSEITIGFDLVPAVDFGTPGVPKQDFDSLSVTASFAMTQANDLRLHETNIVATRDEQSTKLIIRARARSEALEAYTDARLAPELVERWLDSNLLAISGAVPPATVGAQRRQFLPTEIWTVLNAYERELEILRWALGQYEANPRGARKALPSWSLSGPTFGFLRDQLSSATDPVPADRFPSEDTAFDNWITELSDPERARLRAFLTNEYPAVAGQLPFHGIGQSNPLPGPAAGGLDYARKWFAENLYHIGPLRAAPQPLYELPLAASETSVGRNGEFTAAVLSAHGKTRVWCPSPDGKPARMRPLSEAVNEWVKATELLGSVQSADRGKLGYELHLSIPGVKRDLDLTTVGVGVSQALPIIVLGLIAPIGSLLLFEQPELHLHPDVQANLGDFFLALSRTGRQLIVETHSEYLVNRLRRRAAEDANSEIPEEVRLFFFERDAASSSVVPGRIGPGGRMRNWPRGFLDTAAREVEAIATASVRPTDS